MLGTKIRLSQSLRQPRTPTVWHQQDITFINLQGDTWYQKDKNIQGIFNRYAAKEEFPPPRVCTKNKVCFQLSEEASLFWINCTDMWDVNKWWKIKRKTSSNEVCSTYEWFWEVNAVCSKMRMWKNFIAFLTTEGSYCLRIRKRLIEMVTATRHCSRRV